MLKTFVDADEMPDEAFLADYNKDINEASQEYDRGEYITHEDVKKSTWLLMRNCPNIVLPLLKKNLTMKLSLLFIYSLFFLPTFSFSQTTIEFKTTKPNSQKKTIRKIMITGMGNSTARMFLERLSEELSSDLKRRGIETAYQFLGPDPKEANEAFNTLQSSQQYDAIMVIFQSDTTIADRQTRTSYSSIPTSPGTINSPFVLGMSTKSKFIYEQEFKFRLFEKSNTNSLWDALLNLYSDLAKKSVYSDLSLKIITALQQNRIFW